MKATRISKGGEFQSRFERSANLNEQDIRVNTPFMSVKKSINRHKFDEARSQDKHFAEGSDDATSYTKGLRVVYGSEDRDDFMFYKDMEGKKHASDQK